MPVNTEQIYDIAFRNFQGFLSEEDFDGLDLPPQYLSRANGCLVKNGYIGNDTGLDKNALPSAVLTDISAGYVLVYATNVLIPTYSRGTIPLHVLQKSTYEIRVYLDGSLLTIRTPPTSNGYTILGSAEHINHIVVGEEIRLNLNCWASVDFGGGDVRNCMFNLAIKYLTEEIAYTTTIKGTTGFVAFPRWLGWQYEDKREDAAGVYSYTQLLPIGTLEIITGTNYTTKAIVTGYSGLSQRASVTGFIGYNLQFNYSLSLFPGFEFAAGAYIKMEDLYTIGAIGFTAKMKTAGETGTLSVVTSRGHSQYVITDQEQDIIIRLDTIEPDGTFDVVIRNEGDSIILTSAITVIGFSANKVIMIGKTEDKQRFLIPDNMPILLALSAKSKITFSHKKEYLDYRVTDYELYVQLEESGLYYLVAHAEVDGSWSEVTIDGESYVQREMEYYDSDEIQTLNFNYGLGASVMIASNPLNQFLIYSEVHLRGRQYFVNGTNKIYQSHIAGNGKLQMDSFPVDQATKFGFIEGEQTQYIKVAVSLFKELVLLSDKEVSVMQIQYNTGGVAFKRLRQASSVLGLSEENSFAYVLGGMVWVSESGLLFYGGGQNPPRNLISKEYQYYWRLIEAYGIDCAFYHPAHNEYWMASRSASAFFIYELSYGKFRKISFSDLGIVDVAGDDSDNIFFMGHLNGIPQIIAKDADDSIYKMCDVSSGSYLPIDVQTHYSSGELPYQVDKFLQSIYIGFKRTSANAVTIGIYVDGKFLVNIQITPTQNHVRFGRLVPIGVRFNKIAFTISANANYLQEITEIGCKCSIITPPRGATGEGVLSGGYGTGYGSNYGEQL